MRQIGIVEKISGGEALVRIQRASACGENCASCSGGCAPSRTTVRAAVEAECAEGDRVIVEMESGKVIGAAALVYLIPLIMLFAGYFIGSLFFKEEILCVLTGFAAMVICFFAVSVIDKKLKPVYRHRLIKKIG